MTLSATHLWQLGLLASPWPWPVHLLSFWLASRPPFSLPPSILPAAISVPCSANEFPILWLFNSLQWERGPAPGSPPLPHQILITIIIFRNRPTVGSSSSSAKSERTINENKDKKREEIIMIPLSGPGETEQKKTIFVRLLFSSILVFKSFFFGWKSSTLKQGPQLLVWFLPFESREKNATFSHRPFRRLPLVVATTWRKKDLLCRVQVEIFSSFQHMSAAC